MKTRGFTLVEIMVVVLIIGLLAALAFPLYAKVRLNATRSTAKSDGGQIAAAAQRYCTEKGATIVAISDLVGTATSNYIKQLSRGNSTNASNILLDPSFTFEIDNPFLTAGGLTFDNNGAVVGDPY